MKKTILLFSLLLIIMLSLNSCMMTSKYHITDSPVLQEDEHDGIKVECLYLDREAIIKRHGTKSNPFLPADMVLTPKPAIIFELTIKNLEEGAIKLDIRDIDFYFNNKSYTAMSRSKMEEKIVDSEEKGFSKNKQRRLAKTYMLGDIRKIPGNSEVKGYLVFMKSFKDRGEGELILPFKTPDGFEAGEFSFFYNFLLKK